MDGGHLAETVTVDPLDGLENPASCAASTAWRVGFGFVCGLAAMILLGFYFAAEGTSQGSIEGMVAGIGLATLAVFISPVLFIVWVLAVIFSYLRARDHNKILLLKVERQTRS